MGIYYGNFNRWFSEKQYQIYLNPDKANKKINLIQGLAYLKLASFQALAIYINRLAYFILHHFFIYPNNSYLFQKFKSHAFKNITKEEHQVATAIFNRFLLCSGINQEELNQINEVLKAFNQAPPQPSEPDRSDIPSLPDQKLAEDQGEQEIGNQVNENDEIEKDNASSGIDKLKDNENIEQEVPGQKIEAIQDEQELQRPAPAIEDEEIEQLEEDKTIEQESLDQNEQELVNQVEENNALPAIVQLEDNENIEQELTDQRIDARQEEQEVAIPAIEDKAIEENDFLQNASQSEDEDISRQEEGSGLLDQELSENSNLSGNVSDFSESEQDDDFSDKSEEEASLHLSTSDRLQPLFNHLTSSQLDRIAKEEHKEEVSTSKIIFEPLTQEIENILNQGFLLDENSSLEDLYKNNHHLIRKYRRFLDILLKFEKKIRLEEKQIEDIRFENYLIAADKIFQNDYQKAYEVCLSLNQDFKARFLSDLPILKEGGIITCTLDQYQFVKQTFIQHFPALYYLACDASSFNIHQSHLLHTLFKVILVGAEKEENSLLPFFIQLKETIRQTTPLLTEYDQNHGTFKNGSYIYTSIFGSDKPSPLLIKQSLNRLTHLYVKDWLERAGAHLIFEGQRIIGGQSKENIKASEWIIHFRDTYTNHLLEMPKEKLKKEIDNLIHHPLIKKILFSYQAEIADQDWKNSCFPLSILKKMFEEELRIASDKSVIYESIQKVIEESKFKDLKNLEFLSEKSGCAIHLIEPLIRIRALFIMGCLGQTAIQPVIEGIYKRSKKMYDPNTGELEEGQSLSCETSSKRILTFDQGFDQLSIQVKVVFKDCSVNQEVAQGYSLFKINSISQINEDSEATFIELQDLHFSPYISQFQCHYLTAQVNPKIVIEYLNSIQLSVLKLLLLNKCRDQISHYNPFFSYQTLRDHDKDFLDIREAIQQAKFLFNGINIFNSLIESQQIKESEEMIKVSTNICQDHQYLADNLKKIYPHSPEYLTIQDPIADLDNAIDHVKNILDVQKNSVKEISSNSKAEEPGFIQTVKNNTVGYFIQTPKAEHSKWKIERYEELIKGNQKNIKNYIESTSMDSLVSLIDQAETQVKKGEVTVLTVLLPILKFCTETLENKQSSDSAWLCELRQLYQVKFLTSLRQAAKWAEENSASEGIEHIDAICYQFYTHLDLNNCCQNILKSFQKMGSPSLESENSQHSSRNSLVRDLHQIYDQIRAVPNDAKAPLLHQWANSARGHLNGIWGMTSFDPNMQSNPVHVFYNKNITNKEINLDIHQVKDIAMGSPTIETGDGKVEINPEFLAFLRHCRRLGHKHLYVNNQNFIPKSWIEGNENPRCIILHGLTEGEFAEIFYALTFSQNSLFYEQRDHLFTSLKVLKIKDEIISQLLKSSSGFSHYIPPSLITHGDLYRWMTQTIDLIHQKKFSDKIEFEDESERELFAAEFHRQMQAYIELTYKEKLGYSVYSSVEQFKNEIIAQLFDFAPEVTGNYIPKGLIDRFDLKNWAIKAVQATHLYLFEGRENLTIKERRIFIRLIYQIITRKILIETKVNSYNTSCKDRIDRGSATDAEDYAFLAILAGCMNKPHIIEFFKMLVFVRAIVVRKRAIIKERLERLIETVSFMLDNQASLQNLHAHLFPGIEITIDQFEEKE